MDQSTSSFTKTHSQPPPPTPARSQLRQCPLCSGMSYIKFHILLSDSLLTAHPICPHFKISFPHSFFTSSSSGVASPTHNTASFAPGLSRLVCKRIKSSFEPDLRDITGHWNLKILTKSGASCFRSSFSCIADGGGERLCRFPSLFLSV